jgi:hypothetical protein
MVTAGETLTLTFTVAVWAVNGVGVGVVPVPVLVEMPALTVTVAAFVVFSVDCALPFASVFAVAGDIAPASVVNVIGTPPIGLPFTSKAVAVINDVPPVAGIVVGLASAVTLPTAAAPIAILIAFVPLADTPPEIA